MGKIQLALMNYVGRHRLGVVLGAPVDVLLSDTTVLQPDLLFITEERRGIIKEQNIQGAQPS